MHTSSKQVLSEVLPTLSVVFSKVDPDVFGRLHRDSLLSVVNCGCIKV